MIAKRFMSSLLAVLLLVSNSGLAFNVHFCGGRLSSVSAVFERAGAKPMDCCGSSHKRCCDDKLVSLKKVSENTISKSLSFDSGNVIDLPIQCISGFTARVYWLPGRKAVVLRSGSHSPPLYLLYSQYIFYA